MKKSFIAVSGLTLLMGAGVALAQWDRESFPPFADVDTDGDSMISMEEAKANPDVVNAVTKGNPDTVEDSMKSFFSAAHQKDADKPYDSPITEEEWEGVTSE
jgi:hypothetical protein